MRSSIRTAVAVAASVLATTSPMAFGHAWEEAGAGDAPATGIQVHGHWKVEVFGVDGTKVQEIEFDNALVSPGTLTTLIMDDAVSGGLYLIVTDQNAASTGTGPCDPDCQIATSDMRTGLTPNSNNLTATQQGSDYETLRLAGSVEVANNATIDLLQTWMLVCNGDNNTASQCRGNPDSEGVFTSKILSSGVSVSAGQLVQITVDITFK